MLPIAASDPATNVLDLEGYAQSGILIVGCGGGGDFYPGIYSISRNGTVQTILAAYDITVSSSGSLITIEKGSQCRATALWIKVQD